MALAHGVKLQIKDGTIFGTGVVTLIFEQMDCLKDVADLIFRYSESSLDDRDLSLAYEWDDFWHGRSRGDDFLIVNLIADYTQLLSRVYQTKFDPKTKRSEDYSSEGNEKLRELVRVIYDGDLEFLVAFIERESRVLNVLLAGRNTIHD